MQIGENHPNPFCDRSNVIGKSHCCSLGRAGLILPAQPHPMTQAPSIMHRMKADLGHAPASNPHLFNHKAIT